MRRGSSHKAACFCKATPERGLKAGLDSEKSGYWTASTGLYDGVLRVYCLVTLSLSLLAWVCILKFILFLISLPRGNPYTKSDRRHQFAYDARTYNSRAHTHTHTNYRWKFVVVVPFSFVAFKLYHSWTRPIACYSQSCTTTQTTRCRSLCPQYRWLWHFQCAQLRAHTTPYHPLSHLASMAVIYHKYFPNDT